MIHTDSLFQTTIWFVMELWISACRSYLMLEIPSVVKRLMLGIFYVLFLVSPIFFCLGEGWGDCANDLPFVYSLQWWLYFFNICLPRCFVKKFWVVKQKLVHRFLFLFVVREQTGEGLVLEFGVALDSNCVGFMQFDRHRGSIWSYHPCREMNKWFLASLSHILWF